MRSAHALQGEPHRTSQAQKSPQALACGLKLFALQAQGSALIGVFNLHLFYDLLRDRLTMFDNQNAQHTQNKCDWAVIEQG